MSSDGVALRMRGLSKAYTIRTGGERHITAAEQVLSRLRHPLRRDERTTFWALRDIDLDVAEGTVLGIVGRNGAGKSTLLKVLSRITAPTSGEVELYGRIGSLLEVGTGFHPELTGRENIFLNGAILGMARAEIQREFDAIVEFAGVQTFLDTPVKRYSSGMYVRLAFAVAAHLRTEILLVDEVLAVGDADFQNRCLGKMRDVAEGGRTVLFVSHSMDTVLRLCDRAVLLDAGRIGLEGTPTEVIEHYASQARSSSDLGQRTLKGTEALYISVADAAKPAFTCAEEKQFTFTVSRLLPDAVPTYHVSAHVVDAQRRVVAQLDSRTSTVWGSGAQESATFSITMRSPWLKPGAYDLDLFVCSAGVIDSVTGVCPFEVLPELPYAFNAGDEAIGAAQSLADYDVTIDVGASTVTAAQPLEA